MQIFFSGNGKKLVFIKVVISDYLKNVRARAAGTSSCLLSVLILLTIDLHNSSKDSPTPQQQIMIFPAHFHLSYTSYRKGPSISKASSSILPSLSTTPSLELLPQTAYHAISRRWQHVLGLSISWTGKDKVNRGDGQDQIRIILSILFISHLNIIIILNSCQVNYFLNSQLSD